MYYTLKDLGINRKEGTLSNGTPIIVYEKPNMPIYAMVNFTSGSQYDPVGLSGLSHFLEHMIIAETKDFPKKDMIEEYVGRYGGYINAFTNIENLAVYGEIPDPNDIDVIFKIFNNEITKPLFIPESIEVERKTILTEYGRSKTDPKRLLWENFTDLFLRGTSLNTNTLGNEKSISKIKKEDMVKHYKEMINASRMTCIIGGGIKFEEARNRFEETLIIKRGKSVNLYKKLNIKKTEKIGIVQHDCKEQVLLLLGFNAVNVLSEEYEAFVLLSRIMAGIPSRLFKELRTDKGLVYNVSAFPWAFTNTGTWAIDTSVRKVNTNKVLDIIFKEIDKVKKNGFTQKELDYEKNKIIKSKRLQFQTVSDVMDWHFKKDILGKGSDYLKKYQEDIMNVNNDKIIEIAKKYLNNDNFHLSVCGNITEKEIQLPKLK